MKHVAFAAVETGDSLGILLLIAGIVLIVAVGAFIITGIITKKK